MEDENIIIDLNKGWTWIILLCGMIPLYLIFVISISNSNKKEDKKQELMDLKIQYYKTNEL